MEKYYYFEKHTEKLLKAMFSLYNNNKSNTITPWKTKN